MPQPLPVLPTNMQYTNTYEGLDRGLFIFRGTQAKYARIHAARWKTNGPAVAVGILEYQIMVYADKPETLDDYLEGTLVPAPNGTLWFDTLTRGMVHEPIVAEYWASTSYYNNFSQQTAVMLSDDEKNNAFSQNNLFTETMAQGSGLTSILLNINFSATAEGPMKITSRSMDVKYKVGEEERTLTVTTFPTPTFDPVRVAMNAMKALQG